MPLVSVVMSVYNENINEIKQSISSTLNQTYTNFDYIIVDDNPKSLRIKRFLLYESDKHHKIKLIFNPRNLGAFASYNVGIGHSNSPLILRIDADDVSKGNRLFKQLKFMRRYNLDLVCSNCSVMNTNGQIIMHHYFSDISQYNQQKIKHAMSYCDIANGPTFLFKKLIFEKIGGYRTHVIDDYDFVARALVYGFRVGYQSGDLIIKRYRKDSINNSNILKQFNETYVLSKFLRNTKFTKIIPLIYLNRAFNNVNEKDEEQFSEFIKYRDYFRKNHKFISLVKAVFIILTSKIIFKRFIWIHLIAKRQDSLMK